MDCLFVLPVSHLPLWDLVCSDAAARNTKRMPGLIALVGITFVTCALQLWLVGQGGTLGMLVRPV